MKAKSILPSAIVISTLLAQLTFAALPRYEIIDIGTLGSGYTSANAINEIGQVVGLSHTVNLEGRAFLWDRNNGMIDLGVLPGGGYSEAYSINDCGQVVGFSGPDDGSAFIWDSENGMCYIDGVGYDSSAYAINNAGQVAVRISSAPPYGFLWDPDNGVIDLGTLGGSATAAYVINNAGQVVGCSETGEEGYGTRHAFLWDSINGLIDLGTLGGRYSEARGINDAGQVVGYSEDTYGDVYTFLWDTALDMVSLGNGRAWAINDATQVVGSLIGGPAFYWDSDNGMFILNDLLPTESEWTELRCAHDINNRGQIVGLGITASGEYHGFLMTPVVPTIYYVDADAPGPTYDGLSWTTAFKYLQDALALAWREDEIWVAQGVYKPDRGNGITPGDRTDTFRLFNGVAIKGGYAGFGSPDPNARDINGYETILSGDLNGNDIDVNDLEDLPIEPTRNDNSFHVITSSGTDETTVLDGFTITGGSFPSLFGGGMYNANASPTVKNCIFTANSAWDGGGVCNDNSSPTFIDCTFRGNAACEDGGHGGGMYNRNGSSPTLTNCIITGNFAEGGGGMYGYNSSPTITNCLITGNCANFFGGLARCHGPITNCIISNNLAGYGAGGISWCNGTITNCIIWGNTTIRSTSNQLYKSSTPAYSCIQDWAGGGEGNIDADPCFVNPGYATRWPGSWDRGDYHLLEGSPCIDAGDPNYIVEPNETDLDGKPRIIGGRIDMGAYESPIFAEARIVPRTINLTSKGKWITCYIWLPEEYDVADIDPNSIFLEDEIQPEQFSVDEQAQLATARFSREEVQAILEVGDINLTITGRLTGGTPFEAKDSIRVINKAGGKSAK